MARGRGRLKKDAAIMLLKNFMEKQLQGTQSSKSLGEQETPNTVTIVNPKVVTIGNSEVVDIVEATINKQQEENAGKLRTKLFQSNRLATKGMDLVCFNPIMKDGTMFVQLESSDIDVESEKWKKDIILYVVGFKSTIATFERFIAVKWSFSIKSLIYYHNNGYFVVLFSSIADRCNTPYN
ncbi:hypothetical protein HAX54_026679 [Datura stramonium]|uniref:DUF4283 domain-containing protein n=1 Tax=Datura stramonium TaxID=4076 RepID=A0ABS8S831_DATST|nr:hypothetical protein [Datura stramonium]